VKNLLPFHNPHVLINIVEPFLFKPDLKWLRVWVVILETACSGIAGFTPRVHQVNTQRVCYIVLQAHVVPVYCWHSNLDSGLTRLLIPAVWPEWVEEFGVDYEWNRFVSLENRCFQQTRDIFELDLSAWLELGVDLFVAILRGLSVEHNIEVVWLYLMLALVLLLLLVERQHCHRRNHVLRVFR
jgi:hypothetical protein